MKVLNQSSGKDFTLYQGDSCEAIKGLPDNSVDFSIYSPPFSNLYIYSDSEADMGNSSNDEEFFQHYSFLIKELFRVTVPGRLSAVHAKDLPLYANRDGASGLKDFPGQIIRAHEEAGWVYHSRVTIFKDPVIEMQRTKTHGLLYKNFKVRGEVCRQGMADYLIVFRKWDGLEGTTASERPVRHDPGVAIPYVGEALPEPTGLSLFEDTDDHNLRVWQRYASPVWMDIDQTRVLNYQLAKDNSDEKHICPLQLDVIERSIQLWTNPGDVVFSPFAGIGSEGYSALKLGRKFIGIELKESYFRVAARNLAEAELQANQTDLFAAAGVEVEGVA